MRIEGGNTEKTPCFCVPFVALASYVSDCLSSIAEFFKNFCCSSNQSIDPTRIKSPSPAPSTKIPSLFKETRKSPSNPLIEFYTGGTNDHGITLKFLLESATDSYLEQNHQWVQWAFPLENRSVYNAAAPILDQETITLFRQNPHLQEQLLKMFKRTLRFYGFNMKETGEIIKGDNFDKRAPLSWLKTNDHNHLRITRILKCLQLLQTPSANSWSATFFSTLKMLHNNIVPPKTFAFWQNLHPKI